MQTLQEKDKQYIWHPYTALKGAMEPIPVVKGEGLYMVAENGNKYMDAISSWWVNIHGHAHPFIAKRIYEQALLLEQVIFAGFTHKPAVELAEQLISLLPGEFTRIFYSDNGSTATEVAVKMALQYWVNRSASGGGTKRTRILAFQDAYHGDTFGAMSFSSRSIFTQAFNDKLFEVMFIETPTPENLDTLTNTIRSSGEDIAAFIYEPLLQGAGGMKMYDANLMDVLLGTCRQQNIICIADEVMTGFGRTGRLFASEYMTEKPDIICLSKGLTGGTMALGVTACNQRIVDAFDSDDKLKTFFHGHSFTANPLACTAALASMELLLKSACLESIRMITLENKVALEKFRALPGIKNARCLGTILAFELISGRDGYLNNISRDVTTYLLEKGIYLRPLGNTVYIMPPYCITKEELQLLHEMILEMVGKMEG
jgi:adenosylmethionine-8-amino-7-oxononanoate aminotransferase